MRYLSKLFVVAVALLSIGLLSSSVRANNVLVGKFTLPHPTQWKNTVLPAGDYTFKLATTQTDTHVLSVRGANEALDIMIFPEYACETCLSGELKVAMQGDNRVVTSLDLPGFHMDFKVHESPAELAKTPAPSEQVAVHVATN
jgi:hypothetical protein